MVSSQWSIPRNVQAPPVPRGTTAAEGEGLHEGVSRCPCACCVSGRSVTRYAGNSPVPGASSDARNLHDRRNALASAPPSRVCCYPERPGGVHTSHGMHTGRGVPELPPRVRKKVCARAEWRGARNSTNTATNVTRIPRTGLETRNEGGLEQSEVRPTDTRTRRQHFRK